MNPMARRDIMGSWYLASLVKRYHTWPTLRIETIAEHSHGVAMLYMRMFVDPMDGDTLMRVTNLHAVRWILENDLAELWSGDAPFPVKMRFPNMREAHKEVEREANMALGVRVPQLPVGSASSQGVRPAPDVSVRPARAPNGQHLRDPDSAGRAE
jgi:hypothetical protein